MAVKGVITAEKEELGQLVEQGNNAFEYLGQSAGYFPDGLISRLIHGNPEKWARRSVLKKAREMEANLVLFSGGYYSEPDPLDVRDYHLWADFYRIKQNNEGDKNAT